VVEGFQRSNISTSNDTTRTQQIKWKTWCQDQQQRKQGITAVPTERSTNQQVCKISRGKTSEKKKHLTEYLMTPVAFLLRA
jgi:hypothetical protein